MTATPHDPIARGIAVQPLAAPMGVGFTTTRGRGPRLVHLLALTETF